MRRSSELAALNCRTVVPPHPEEARQRRLEEEAATNDLVLGARLGRGCGLVGRDAGLLERVAQLAQPVEQITERGTIEYEPRHRHLTSAARNSLNS